MITVLNFSLTSSCASPTSSLLPTEFEAVFAVVLVLEFCPTCLLILRIICSALAILETGISPRCSAPKKSSSLKIL